MNKGLIGMSITTMILVTAVILSCILFITFFKYHVEYYMSTSDVNTRSSSVVMNMFTLSYDNNESYSIQLNRNLIKNEIENNFEKYHIETISRFLHPYCFKIKIDDFILNDWETGYEFPYYYNPMEEIIVCGDDEIYHNRYMIPVICDGTDCLARYDLYVYGAG